MDKIPRVTRGPGSARDLLMSYFRIQYRAIFVNRRCCKTNTKYLFCQLTFELGDSNKKSLKEYPY